jgi:hypothetical protein
MNREVTLSMSWNTREFRQVMTAEARDPCERQ